MQGLLMLVGVWCAVMICVLLSKAYYGKYIHAYIKA